MGSDHLKGTPEEIRSHVNEDVAAFLAKGGKIKLYGMGATAALPLSYNNQQSGEAREPLPIALVGGDTHPKPTKRELIEAAEREASEWVAANVVVTCGKRNQMSARALMRRYRVEHGSSRRYKALSRELKRRGAWSAYKNVRGARGPVMHWYGLRLR